LAASVLCGPSALARVLPDLRAAIGPMVAAARALGAPPTSPETALAGELMQRLVASLSRLDAELEAAQADGLRAARRLRLERDASRARGELLGTLGLLDLLSERERRAAVPVALADVFREVAERPSAPPDGAPRLTLYLEEPPPPAAVLGNPREIVRVIRLAAALVAGPRDQVTVAVRLAASGCELRLTAGATDGAPLIVPRPATLDLTTPVLLGVARLAGWRAEVEEGASAWLLLEVASAE
ncbi:MAG: hypothetical protein FJ104_05425, partial [Deltaproteobacteria bacterium]|nr:hypothetical protein [Deltaproteobacteria bacterium]